MTRQVRERRGHPQRLANPGQDRLAGYGIVGR
jgi:hypothetical protein